VAIERRCCNARSRGERLRDESEEKELGGEEGTDGENKNEGVERVLGPEVESRLARLGRALCVLLRWMSGGCVTGERGKRGARRWYC